MKIVMSHKQGNDKNSVRKVRKAITVASDIKVMPIGDVEDALEEIALIESGVLAQQAKVKALRDDPEGSKVGELIPLYRNCSRELRRIIPLRILLNNRLARIQAA